MRTGSVKNFLIYQLFLALLGCFLWPQAAFSELVKSEQTNCQLWPPVLKDMPIGQASFLLDSGEKIDFNFRKANTGKRSTHGFQFTCAETIESTKIMFYFKRSIIPSFHMNNVKAPLDIAFIDKDGKITDILLMKTYSNTNQNKPLYSPSSPALFALETHAGYFAKQGIMVGDQIIFY